ncbi:hypothetical protein PLCT2_00179 [Planctomycetaceae bacterium]|nr:hypothetical protein PLCT2_00179 [Planctomycetaceae bacterium]
MGQSVAVADAFYVGALTNIDKSATTLETAMGLKVEHFEQALRGLS